VVENTLTKFTAVSKVTRTHPRLLAVLRMSSEDTAVALIDLDELLHESLDLCLRRRSRMLDHTDAPARDRTVLVIHREFTTAARS
jgi:hypothetical protein